MSQVYSTEPVTSGLVVFETTHGPLSIHLWCKECPTTCRFFLQLCLDGFYDNLIFQRIIPNFLIQTGDASFRQNTSEKAQKQPPDDKYRHQHQADQAMQRRQYELNSRIRFNHRGQVAMALGVDDDNDGDADSVKSLQPQFFITLEEAAHLDGKHVCFGGINGPTMFNALRIGQVDVNDDTYQPRILDEAPRITRVKIQNVDLPATLPALVPTPEPPLLPWRRIMDSSGKGGSTKPKKKKRKAVKNVNLLSFGEEMNQEDDGVGTGKIQSSHDVLAKEVQGAKSRFVNQVDEELEQRLKDDKSGEDKKAQQSNKKKAKEEQPKNDADTDGDNEHAPSKEIEMEPTREAAAPTFVSRKSAPPPPAEEKKEEPKSQAPKAPKPKKMSLVEARRAKYAKKTSSKKKGDKQKREDDTMAKFMNFQKKIMQEKATSGSLAADQSDSYHGQVTEGDIEDGNSDWIKTTFKCKRHMDHDASKGSDGRVADDYKVVEERNAPTDRKHDRKKRRH